ncbi:MAG: 4-oxalocrotonate tautomerase family protein [Aggregatilineales bacterium]
MPTVLVYWSPGRSSAQKARVIRGITDVLVEEGGARKEDVTIIFQDISPGDAGRGGEPLVPPAFSQPKAIDTSEAHNSMPPAQPSHGS